MSFQLNTSGSVGEMPGWRTPVPTCNRFMRWSDLSPFTQGYIEAALHALDEQRMAHYQDRRSRGLPEAVPIRAAYSWLAPETLARIIADCERFRAVGRREGFKCADDTAEHGERFWQARNSRPWPGRPTIYQRDGFPPLTVQLGDDGKVRFAAPSEERRAGE